MRSVSPLSLSLLICCAVILTTPMMALGSEPVKTATATAKVVDALSGDAKDAFNDARLRFAKQEYAAARESYTRAYELSKDPRVLYNVAVCLKEEGKYASAIRVLEQSVAESTKQTPREYRERVADTIDTLMPLVAIVTAEGLGDGMTVMVDQNVVPTNARGAFLVDAGTRVLTVAKPNFTPQSFARDFPPNEHYTFAVSLSPLPARLSVTTVPTIRDATVLLDGRVVGVGPTKLSAAPGAHEIVVRAPGFHEARRAVELRSGEDELAEVNLEADQQKQQARLRVTAGSNDTIAVDGKVVGRGSVDAEVPVGEHRIVVSRPDAEPRVTEVVLRDRETRDMRVTLDTKKGGGAGIPSWVWILGGAVAVGGVSTAVFFAVRPTDYEGSTPGTLSPRVVPASANRGAKINMNSVGFQGAFQ